MCPPHVRDTHRADRISRAGFVAAPGEETFTLCFACVRVCVPYRRTLYHRLVRRASCVARRGCEDDHRRSPDEEEARHHLLLLLLQQQQQQQQQRGFGFASASSSPAATSPSWSSASSSCVLPSSPRHGSRREEAHDPRGGGRPHRVGPAREFLRLRLSERLLGRNVHREGRPYNAFERARAVAEELQARA